MFDISMCCSARRMCLLFCSDNLAYTVSAQAYVYVPLTAVELKEESLWHFSTEGDHERRLWAFDASRNFRGVDSMFDSSYIHICTGSTHSYGGSRASPAHCGFEERGAILRLACICHNVALLCFWFLRRLLWNSLTLMYWNASIWLWCILYMWCLMPMQKTKNRGESNFTQNNLSAIQVDIMSSSCWNSAERRLREGFGQKSTKFLSLVLLQWFHWRGQSCGYCGRHRLTIRLSDLAHKFKVLVLV